MTIDTLLKRLSKTIKIRSTIGYLTLEYVGNGWCASYSDTNNDTISLNPDDPGKYAAYFSESPNEALKGLYDWCKKYKVV